MPPQYSTIKELDCKVRHFHVTPQKPQAIRGRPGVDPRSVPIPASMIASLMLLNIQDVVELMLLRCYDNVCQCCTMHLSSHRVPIGYTRCNKIRTDRTLIDIERVR